VIIKQFRGLRVKKAILRGRKLMGETVSISDLMVQSGVKFGTSGARGLADDMTDRVCYAYTAAFIQYLEETGELKGGGVSQ